MEGIDVTKIPHTNTITKNAEATQIPTRLAKEVLKSGKISEDITKADQKSSSEYITTFSMP